MCKQSRQTICRRRRYVTNSILFFVYDNTGYLLLSNQHPRLVPTASVPLAKYLALFFFFTGHLPLTSRASPRQLGIASRSLFSLHSTELLYLVISDRHVTA